MFIKKALIGKPDDGGKQPKPPAEIRVGEANYIRIKTEANKDGMYLTSWILYAVRWFMYIREEQRKGNIICVKRGNKFYEIFIDR